MDVNNYIDHRLEDVRDGLLNRLSDEFIFAYGPYMCMTSGYERECDEIARYNKWMAIMVHASYLIRKITSGISYGDAKKVIRNFNISVDNTFEDMDVKNALMNFSNKYLSKIREEQKVKGDLESFMTTASPIVPYEQTIKRADQVDSSEAEEMVHADIIGKLPNDISVLNLRKEIINLLLNNLAEIMLNYNLCTVLVQEDTNLNLLKLDNITIRKPNVSIDTQKYYFLTTINYYKLYDTPEFIKYMKFFEEAGDFSKNQSYSAFESMIDSMAKSTNIDIAAESWDDPSMDAKEEATVSNIIKSQTRIVADEDRPKYDFGILNDFINVKRFMKFEEFPNRLFIGSLERARIININNMGGDRNYYEMDNNTVACPFLDLRTYQPGVIVLYADTNEIQIYDDMNEIY